MNRSLSVLLLLAVVCAASFSLSAQTTNGKASGGEKFSGVWSGTFEGDSSGKFEMTLTPAADGKHTGNLTVTPNDGDSYSVNFKSVVFDGDKVIAKYPAPGDNEVVMEGTSDGQALSGSWSFREQDSRTAGGTWKGAKKAK